jgi:hypothetical protein
MTPLELTLLLTIGLILLGTGILSVEYARIKKQYKAYLFDMILFTDKTLNQIEKLEVALEKCRKEKSPKPKAKKNEKTTTTK